MDRVVARPRVRRWLILGTVVAAVIAVTVASRAVPRGLTVSRADIEVDVVRQTQFQEEILLRATAAPLKSVRLDSSEAGRVEVVTAVDGAQVKRGELLFQLSNTQRQQEALARAADVAQQVANLATMRAALSSMRAENRRRVSQLSYDLERARKEHARNESLFQQGFLSHSAVERSADSVEQYRRLVLEAEADAAAEEAIRARAISEMNRVLDGLNEGLALVRTATDALAVRAPIDGRLTDFRLEVGESVKVGDRLGRIDTPEQYKLIASVDEFYLGRIEPGLTGYAQVASVSKPIFLSRLNSQVKDRRFEIELEFKDDARADLQPGQTIDVRLTMGAVGLALLLREGAFYGDTAGAWTFVLSPDETTAERRSVKLGRRSGGQIEVLSGLAEGEKVITSGYGAFGDSTRLRISR